MGDEEDVPLLENAGLQSKKDISRTIIKKLDRRILIICALYSMIVYIDRNNIGYAAQNLCEYLDMNNKEYGTGISLFYVLHPIANLTGNLVLKKVGGPAWLAFMCFTWGCVSTSMAFISSKIQFYAIRVLLGLAQGGFFPGVSYYLSLFYSEESLTGSMSVLVAAMLFAETVSAPIAAGLLSSNGFMAFDGWRLLFLVEGLIPIVFSVIVYFLLSKTANEASFLDDDEKKWISDESIKCHAHSIDRPILDQIKTVLSNRSMWLGIINGFSNFGIYAVISNWFVLIIGEMLDIDTIETNTCASTKDNSVQATLLVIIPATLSGFGCAILRLFQINNRPRFVFLTEFAGGICLVLWIYSVNISFVLAFAISCLAFTLLNLACGPNIALCISLFDNSTKLVASSVLNSLISLGGIVCPIIMGWILDRYNYEVGVSVCGAMMCIAGLAAAFMDEPLISNANAYATR